MSTLTRYFLRCTGLSSHQLCHGCWDCFHVPLSLIQLLVPLVPMWQFRWKYASHRASTLLGCASTPGPSRETALSGRASVCPARQVKWSQFSIIDHLGVGQPSSSLPARYLFWVSSSGRVLLTAFAHFSGRFYRAVCSECLSGNAHPLSMLPEPSFLFSFLSLPWMWFTGFNSFSSLPQISEVLFSIFFLLLL